VHRLAHSAGNASSIGEGTALAVTSDLEEVEGLHGGVVQPHVLAQLQGGQAEGVEVGLIRQELQEAHHRRQT